MESGISTSSSRNSVPLEAASRRPSRDRMAPVNAPSTCPNISDSKRLSGMAAQFTSTSGLFDRALC